MTHALLSPSAAHRWLNCTKSVKLEEQFPDSTSDAALEGTIAHAICALLLCALKAQGTYDVKEIQTIAQQGREGYTPEQFATWFSADMMQYAEGYANYVWNEYQAEIQLTPDAILMVEKKIDISRYGKDMTGTTDAAIVGDAELHIFDFKYGRGVLVDAKENPQMMIYALGNIEEHASMYAFKAVTMTIYQPRISNISHYSMSVKDLQKWGTLTLKPKAADAYAGKGVFAPGAWCKFCRAKAICLECANACTSDYKEKHDKSVDTLTDNEIVHIIEITDDITSWLDSIKSYASEQLKNGKPINGLKLVEGRSTRKYSDADKVAELLLSSGFTEEQIYDKKLKALTAMQKTLTKKTFDALLADLIVKPQGAPTLALESDPRPVFNDASKEFENIDV